MRVLIIDKTAGLHSSHERHQALGSLPEVDLHVLGPHHWVENGRPVMWEIGDGMNYTPHFGRVIFKDYYARACYYSGMMRAFRHSQPDLIQLLEEPWSLTTLQTLIMSSIFAPQAKLLFYTWENIYRPWQYPSRISRLYALIDKAMHSCSSGAVCATEGARKVLLQKGYQHPTTVIPYGIPQFFLQDHSNTKRKADGFTIGYIGRLLEMKGVDLLIQAIKDLPDYRLHLIGSGEDENRFKLLARKLDVYKRIEWSSSIPEEQIPAALKQLDVLVLPSRATPGWQEQLGRVLIEAMAMGVPVIGANTGAISEVIGDAGWLFETENPAHLLKQIKHVRDHKETTARCVEIGRQRVNTRFTWPVFAQQLHSFYQSIVEGCIHE